MSPSYSRFALPISLLYTLTYSTLPSYNIDSAIEANGFTGPRNQQRIRSCPPILTAELQPTYRLNLTIPRNFDSIFECENAVHAFDQHCIGSQSETSLPVLTWKFFHICHFLACSARELDPALSKRGRSDGFNQLCGRDHECLTPN